LKLPETKIIDDIGQAVDALRQGLIVAFPTETVYGLGVDATNEAAVRRLFEAKGRPSDNPLIVHLGSAQRWPLAARRLTESAELLLKTFSPGPITVVVEKLDSISPLVTAGLNTVGLRVPGHESALQLLQLCDLAIAAPSANRSGRPSCTTWQSVLEDMDGRIDFVLRGDICEVGLESTVVECTGEHPVILRTGKVTLHQIQQVFPSARMYNSNMDPQAQQLASPGVRHAHYQPMAKVKLFESYDELSAIAPSDRKLAAVIGLEDSSERVSQESFDGFSLVKRFDSLEQYSQEIYELLRHIDRCGIATLYMQLVDLTDQSAALRDRQLRAAGAKG
jgi:L-threonylcarbamoyladenylate synthase